MRLPCNLMQVSSASLKFRVPIEVRQALQTIAQREGKRMPDLLRDLVRRELIDVHERLGLPVPGWWEEEPNGQRSPMDNTSFRQTLPADVANGLRRAFNRAGLSYRQAGRPLGIDPGYLHRLTVGSRCPSVEVAERLIHFLPVDALTAGRLKAVAVHRRFV